ncbi:KUP/HAK/KT family potassium transporter [Erythrobacter sp. W302b]|uniref:KUP/HAK/KT family potassium transporter n=1 Tax=Erythrobacter sp. W302b TaxID=3389874 RepID=UPI00396AFFC9
MPSSPRSPSRSTEYARPQSTCPPRLRGVPSALLHNLKHNQVLHARVLNVTVKVEAVC